MDLAKERNTYWQSYQAFDAPEWTGSHNRGIGSDRVQQEPPEGIGFEIGSARAGRGQKKKSTFPERLI